MLRRFAICVSLVLTSQVALAETEQDCFNRKLDAEVIQRACTKLIAKRPDDARLYVARANGQHVVRPSNYSKLMADYIKALSLDDRLVAAYLGRARLKAQYTTFRLMPVNFDPSAHATDILSDLNRAVELEPENATARQDRGFHYMVQEQPELALVDYEALVKLEPNEHLSYSGRAWAHLEAGHYAQAVQDYDISFKLAAPSSRRSFAQRGLAHSLNGDDLAAIKDYDQAIKDQTAFHDTQLHRIFALFNLGDYKQAAKILVRERETVSDISWKLLRFHALAQANLHRDPAYNDFVDVLKYDDWYNPLVELHSERRDVSAVTVAMENQPAKNKCIAFFFIGQWQIFKQDKVGAKTSFQKALAICPNAAVERAAAKVALKKLG